MAVDRLHLAAAQRQAEADQAQAQQRFRRGRAPAAAGWLAAGPRSAAARRARASLPHPAAPARHRPQPDALCAHPPRAAQELGGVQGGRRQVHERGQRPAGAAAAVRGRAQQGGQQGPAAAGARVQGGRRGAGARAACWRRLPGQAPAAAACAALPVRRALCNQSATAMLAASPPPSPAQVPNVDNLTEPGKKAPKKTWDIKLHSVWGPGQATRLTPEVYTPAGVRARRAGRLLGSWWHALLQPAGQQQDSARRGSCQGGTPARTRAHHRPPCRRPHLPTRRRRAGLQHPGAQEPGGQGGQGAQAAGGAGHHQARRG